MQAHSQVIALNHSPAAVVRSTANIVCQCHLWRFQSCWKSTIKELLAQISTSGGAYSQSCLHVWMDYWTSGEAQQVDLGNVEINKAEKARHCNWRAGSALLTLLFIQISKILPCSSPRDVRTQHAARSLDDHPACWRCLLDLRNFLLIV
jgi:hypothetical protein